MRVVTTLSMVSSYMSPKQAQQFKGTLPSWANEGSVMVYWVVKSMKPAPKVVAQLEMTEPKRWLALSLSKGYVGLYIQIKSSEEQCFEDLVVVQRVPREIVEYIEQKKAPSWQGDQIKVYTPMHQKHPGIADYALLGAIEYKNQLCILISDQKEPLQSISWNVFGVDLEKRSCWNLGVSVDRSFFSDFQKTGVEEDVLLNKGVVAIKKNLDFLNQLPKSVVFQWVFSPFDEVGRLPKGAQKFKLGESLPS